MSFNFFGLLRESRDKVYAETWAATTNKPLDHTPSIYVAAEFAGTEASYESFLETAKSLMANRRMLFEAMEEFYLYGRTKFTRMSRLSCAQDPTRLGSIGRLLSPLRAREIEYIPYLIANDVWRVWTGNSNEFLIFHRFCMADRYFMGALARKLANRNTLSTFKVSLEVSESHHEHHRFPIHNHLACFKSLIDKGCKVEIEAKAGKLLPRTHPTTHDALLLLTQILHGDTFEGSVLSSTHGYDLEEDEVEDRAVEDCVVYKWNATFTRA